MNYYPVFLGLGSNIGDREYFLHQAIIQLESSKTFHPNKISSLYKTAPKYFREQEYFYNLTIEGSTNSNPDDLLEQCKIVEEKLGRNFSGRRYGPRQIDIDILFFNNRVIRKDILFIPHQKIAERMFVLKPLSEIAPDFIHPLLKSSVQELLINCRDNDYIEKIKDINSWISY